MTKRAGKRKYLWYTICYLSLGLFVLVNSFWGLSFPESAEIKLSLGHAPMLAAGKDATIIRLALITFGVLLCILSVGCWNIYRHGKFWFNA